MRIAVFGLTEEDKINYIRENITEHQIVFYDHELDQDNLPPEVDFEVISIFADSSVNSKVIDFFPNLKMIAVRATGFDNVDTAYAKTKGIVVSNVPSYGSHTVAEFTFGLILSLSRKIPEAIDRVKSESGFEYSGLKGFDLFEKTLGVIGTGRIGTNVIKIAKGFGMKILAFDLYPKETLAAELGFEYVPLEGLLKLSDIVTVHIPSTKESFHLINSDNIALMKKEALLVNTSRGVIVETKALLRAIENKQISGIALDVMEDEAGLKDDSTDLLAEKLEPAVVRNLLSEKILIENPNVIVTPHAAFYTKEAETTILQETVANIKNFFNGQPSNVVS